MMMTAGSWGLLCDIVGFALIVWEWQKGVTQAEREAVEAALNVGAWGMSDDEKPAARIEALAKIRSALRPRKLVFSVGAVLILLGFGLQFWGSLAA